MEKQRHAWRGERACAAIHPQAISMATVGAMPKNQAKTVSDIMFLSRSATGAMMMAFSCSVKYNDQNLLIDLYEQ